MHSGWVRIAHTAHQGNGSSWNIFWRKGEAIIMSYMAHFHTLWEKIVIIEYSMITLNIYFFLSYKWWVSLIKYMMGPITYVRWGNTHLMYSWEYFIIFYKKRMHIFVFNLSHDCVEFTLYKWEDVYIWCMKYSFSSWLLHIMKREYTYI